MGDSDGDGHRLRGRHPRARRKSRAPGLQGLPDGARRRRRSHRGGRDRDLLRRRRRLSRPRARGGSLCRAPRPEPGPCRGPDPLSGDRCRDVGRDGEVRCPPDRGRRPPRIHRSGGGWRSGAPSASRTRPSPVGRLSRHADLRVRERRRDPEARASLEPARIAPRDRHSRGPVRRQTDRHLRHGLRSRVVRCGQPAGGPAQPAHAVGDLPPRRHRFHDVAFRERSRVRGRRVLRRRGEGSDSGGFASLGGRGRSRPRARARRAGGSFACPG